LLIFNEITCTSDDVIQLYDDLLLVAGSVRNQITKCVYEAPIFIKRSLSKQGLKLLEGRSVNKILVLPRNIKTKSNYDLITDSSLIRHILDNETQRDFNRRLSDRGRFKTNPTKMSGHNRYKTRTYLTKNINDTDRYLQTDANINRLLLATGNILKGLELFIFSLLI
jgi:hypothetical protein